MWLVRYLLCYALEKNSNYVYNIVTGIINIVKIQEICSNNLEQQFKSKTKP